MSTTHRSGTAAIPAPSATPPFFCVGIGASAGGQQALDEFFTHLPPDTLAAYFVVTHLSRYHKTHLSEIIGRHTAMPVISVDRSMQIRAGAVYTLVENTVITIDDHGLLVQARIKSETINRAIDTFFISMARHCGRRAIGIILSGGGTDGTLGALEIYKYGGEVLVQSPGSSLLDGMPNSIIGRDHPSAILNPAQLAEYVGRLVLCTSGKAGHDH